MSPKYDQLQPERPIYSHAEILKALDTPLSTEQMHKAARSGFGEMMIGDKPLYVGMRKGGKSKFSNDFMPDGTPAIFVGHGERTAEEALSATIDRTLSMFRRGQLGIGPETPMIAQPSDEFKARRAALHEAVYLIAIDRLEGVDASETPYAVHLDDLFTEFVGQPVPGIDQEDMITRTIDYIEYCVEQSKMEQPQA